MTAFLYIVRHGNTFEPGDVVTRVGGRTDLPLSPSGQVQADALGRHFETAGVRFFSAAVGPLRRTRETATAILARQPEAPAATIEPFLREIDYGPDENRPEPEVVARIGAAALEAWETQGVPPPGWRVDAAALVANWAQLFQDLAWQTGAHLVVTSNGVARFALAAVGADMAQGKLRTGAYGVLHLSGEAVQVGAWNVRP
jgi:broad specificity phosphatase PhoE